MDIKTYCHLGCSSSTHNLCVALHISKSAYKQRLQETIDEVEVKEKQPRTGI